MVKEYRSYLDMSIQHQKDIDAFPMAFIFRDGKTSEQIADELFAALGTRSLDDVCVSPVGIGLIRKDAVEAFTQMLIRHEKERELFNNNSKNLKQAIITEMRNHEYGYTREPFDTLMALGKTEHDLDTDEVFRAAWLEASKVVIKEDEG